MEPDPEQAPKVREIFGIYAQGNIDITTLADHAKQIGLRARSGETPSRNMIHLMLRNPFYVGRYTWRGQSFRGVHEPLIDGNLWNRVQEVMRERTNHKTKGKINFALKGLLSCFYCDHTLTAQWTTGRHGHRMFIIFATIARMTFAGEPTKKGLCRPAWAQS